MIFELQFLNYQDIRKSNPLIKQNQNYTGHKKKKKQNIRKRNPLIKQNQNYTGHKKKKKQ